MVAKLGGFKLWATTGFSLPSPPHHDRGDDDGAAQADGARADRGGERVGHIVRACCVAAKVFAKFFGKGLAGRLRASEARAREGESEREGAREREREREREKRGVDSCQWWGTR
jgi:hypothetical protein